jgi:hypothetical protein
MDGETAANLAATYSLGYGASFAVEGKDWVFEDQNFNTGGTGVVQTRTNHYVRCRVIRNMAAATLFASQVVLRNDSAPGLNFSQANGLCYTTAQDVLGVVDEWLGPNGCLQYDLCWVVMDGPTLCYTDLAGGANNVFTVGERVVALTAATSGATTAGRIAPQTLNGTTLSAQEENELQNVIGRAMSAATTGNTNSQLLVYVGKF